MRKIAAPIAPRRVGTNRSATGDKIFPYEIGRKFLQSSDHLPPSLYRGEAAWHRHCFRTLPLVLVT